MKGVGDPLPANLRDAPASFGPIAEHLGDDVIVFCLEAGRTPSLHRAAQVVDEHLTPLADAVLRAHELLAD